MLKNILKKTFFYRYYKLTKLTWRSYQWTEQDRQMLDFYADLIPSCGLCFDVGANMGNRSRIFMRIPADVVAVEPQPSCNWYLERLFAEDECFYLHKVALGAQAGTAEMNLSEVDTLFSLSPEWIDSVRKSGRFQKNHWQEKITVTLMTLDELIAIYGVPNFIKIDVEGFEEEVVKGLTQPVKKLSLEFTPEYLETTYRCLDHLAGLGKIELNYALGEEMRLLLPEWVSLSAMKQILETKKNDLRIFGDLYIRFVP